MEYGLNNLARMHSTFSLQREIPASIGLQRVRDWPLRGHLDGGRRAPTIPIGVRHWAAVAPRRPARARRYSRHLVEMVEFRIENFPLYPRV
jgi:hypothetical protein